MLNKYLSNLEELISKYRDRDLGQFEGSKRKKAEFDDLVWYYIDPNTGRKTRLLSTCYYQNKSYFNGDDIDVCHSLPEIYSHLVKVWMIEISNRSYSMAHFQSLVIQARKVLTLMEGDLFQQDANSMQKIWEEKNMTSFFQFCFDNQLLPKFEVYKAKERDRSGAGLLEKRYSKLPSDESLLALGAIFNEVFKDINTDGSVRIGGDVNVHDAMTMTFSCLSLASPNRLAAEITVIQKQKLGVYSEECKPDVCFLNWKGSKGYQDNKNHVLSVLSEQIEKSLNFFIKHSESARILCRFYENPKQTLKILLGDFPIDPKRNQFLVMDRAPNLFHLGYALGFYDIDEHVYVLKDSSVIPPRNSRKVEHHVEIPIYSLRNHHVVKVSEASRYDGMLKLFGAVYHKKTRIFGMDLYMTASDLQNKWISFVSIDVIPEFPFCYSSSETYIKLKNALFCLLGSTEAGKKSGRRPMERSFFYLVPLSYISDYVSRRLSGNTKWGTSIFEDYGFSNEVGLLPHSLRHYANTLADMSEIPLEIITAWSGRTNKEQTHTYIHTSEEEKADRVRAIINPSKSSSRSIRVVSASNLTQATNLPATITSTGICIQELNVTPCNYLNDFLSHCVMCSDSCHIAGDIESINYLEKDLQYQDKRLDVIRNDSRLANSRAMQDWYVIHARNTAILSMLVGLMKGYPKGTIIRFSNSDNEFNLTDLTTKKVSNVKLSLSDPKDDLRRLIENETEDSSRDSNIELQSLLSSFGLSKEVI